jgi:subtilisin family serine protease
MKRFLRAPALITAALVALAAAPGAQASAGGGQVREADAIPGRYVVLYERSVGSTGARTRALQERVGFDAGLRYRAAVGGFAAELSPTEADTLEATPGVDLVSPDRPVSALAAEPLAPGDSVPTGVARIEAATAATVSSTGANVAVIDTGIDLDHPDLDARDGVNCVQPGTPAEDDNGHGTHVAGTIAAENDGAGVVGVAAGAPAYAVKVLDADGSGAWSQLICGIDWVTATRTDADPGNDVAVANMSLGGLGDPVGTCATTSDALHRAICRATDAGVVFAVAAGNDAWDFDYAPVPDIPAAYPEVLTVTALADSDGAPGGEGAPPACRPDESDEHPASFSNFALTAAGEEHTIAAPGVCIRSTWPGGGYRTLSGTSMATPHVAGALALCVGGPGSPGPCSGMTPGEVADWLRGEAEDRSLLDALFGFIGDPLNLLDERIYGFLAWSGFALTEPGAEEEPGDPAPPPGEPVQPPSGDEEPSPSSPPPEEPGDPGSPPDASDAQPPDTAISGRRTLATRARTHARRARFVLSATESGARFECRLGRETRFAPCAPLYRSVKLRPGRYTLHARAVDAAGNTDPTPAHRRFRIVDES